MPCREPETPALRDMRPRRQWIKWVLLHHAGPRNCRQGNCSRYSLLFKDCPALLDCSGRQVFGKRQGDGNFFRPPNISFIGILLLALEVVYALRADAAT